MPTDENEYLERWEVRYVTVQPGTRDDKKKLESVLKEGWEPFSVTWDGHAFDYHLRKFYFEETHPDSFDA